MDEEDAGHRCWHSCSTGETLRLRASVGRAQSARGSGDGRLIHLDTLEVKEEVKSIRAEENNMEELECKRRSKVQEEQHNLRRC